MNSVVGHLGASCEGGRSYAALGDAVAVGDHESRHWLIDELSTLRFIVEPVVAAFVVELTSATEKLRLFEAHEEMEANKDIPERAVDADILFHRRMLAIARNKFLSALLQTVVLVLRANVKRATKAQHEVIEFLEEHRLVAGCNQ